MKHGLASITATALMIVPLISCSKSESPETANSNEIRTYTGLFSATGRTLPENNEIQQLIAKKTGAVCIEKWVEPPEDKQKTFSEMIVTGNYYDFLSPDAENYQKLLKANAFIPIDEYWDSYPNIKDYLSESQWNMMRQ